MPGYESPLRRARLERGWSQERLAKEIGVGRQSLLRYELHGDLPGPEIVARIKDILEIDLATVDHSPSRDQCERLRQARAARGWTQGDLAREVGVAQKTVESWEQRPVTPRADIALRVEEVLGTTIFSQPETTEVQKKITAALAERGWTRAELSARAGIARVTLWSVETGAKKPDERTRAAINAALGREIFEGVVQMDKEKAKIEWVTEGVPEPKSDNQWLYDLLEELTPGGPSLKLTFGAKREADLARSTVLNYARRTGIALTTSVRNEAIFVTRKQE